MFMFQENTMGLNPPERQVNRMYNKRFGHKTDGYTHMQLVMVGTPEEGKFLETGLIRHYQSRKVQGLQNQLPGGENAPRYLCWVYVVAADGSSGSLLKAAYKKRSQRTL